MQPSALKATLLILGVVFLFAALIVGFPAAKSVALTLNDLYAETAEDPLSAESERASESVPDDFGRAAPRILVSVPLTIFGAAMVSIAMRLGRKNKQRAAP